MGHFSVGRGRRTRGDGSIESEIQKDVADLRNIIMELAAADAGISWPFRITYYYRSLLSLSRIILRLSWYNIIVCTYGRRLCAVRTPERISRAVRWHNTRTRVTRVSNGYFFLSFRFVFVHTSTRRRRVCTNIIYYLLIIITSTPGRDARDRRRIACFDYYWEDVSKT